jgi:hypothetical protein
LLFSDRQALRPVSVLVEPLDQLRQADPAQSRDEAITRKFRGSPRIGERVGQRTERQIRALWQEQGAAIAQFDSALSERPQPRDCA